MGSEPLPLARPTPGRIVVVCTGNICRSPMAAGFILHHLRLAGLDDRAVQSRGTHAVVGHRAVQESIDAARLRGVDISQHRALQFTRSDVNWADVILVMEREHAELIAGSYGGDARPKLRLFGGYAGLFDIDDPFGGDAARFRTVADQIWTAAAAFVRTLVENR
ncbi:MAG: low molecular weight protein-tyrosine-phosphatase [Planctomycetota bacterium]